MAKHKVEITGINTSELKTLTNEEMYDLFVKLKEGDRTAKEKIANGNLKLVLSILKRFNKKDENMDDLFQIGCIGLMKAIDNFDLSYNVKFSTYSVPMILGEIRRYLRDNSSIRVSRSLKDICYKVLNLKDKLTIENGKEPTNKQLADLREKDEKEIDMALLSLRPTVSLFEPIYNDGGDTIYLFDQVEDKSQDYDLDTKITIDKAIKNLDERERNILENRFIIGKTQMEIAKELDISQAQISRLEKNALQKIRKKL